MTTLEELYQRARGMGLSDEDARREVRLQAPFLPPSPAAPAPSQPAFTWARYDDIDRRAEAQLDRDMDPQRAARAARERERIEAKMQPLVEQRDALNKQIAALNEEWQQWM
jgi:hypothetical protein